MRPGTGFSGMPDATAVPENCGHGAAAYSAPQAAAAGPSAGDGGGGRSSRSCRSVRREYAAGLHDVLEYAPISNASLRVACQRLPCESPAHWQCRAVQEGSPVHAQYSTQCRGGQTSQEESRAYQSRRGQSKSSRAYRVDEFFSGTLSGLLVSASTCERSRDVTSYRQSTDCKR